MNGNNPKNGFKGKGDIRSKLARDQLLLHRQSSYFPDDLTIDPTFAKIADEEEFNYYLYTRSPLSSSRAFFNHKWTWRSFLFEFKLFTIWAVKRVCQTLLLYSSSSSLFFYKVTANPSGFISMSFGLGVSELNHFISMLQWIVSGVVFALNGFSFNKFTPFTKVLFTLNMMSSLMHLRFVKDYFSAITIARNLPQFASNEAAKKILFGKHVFRDLLFGLIPFISPQLLLRFKQDKFAIKTDFDVDVNRGDEFNDLETRAYVDMKTVDPKLFAAIAVNPLPFEKTISLLGGRGPRKTWQDIDIYRNRGVIASLKNNEKRKFPVLMYVHGGAWSLSDKSFGLAGTLDYLVERYNIILVKANYRMAPERRMSQQLLDVKRAIQWARRHIADFGGDVNNIGICGESAGGHLSLLTSLTNDPSEYKFIFDNIATNELDEAEYGSLAKESKVDLVMSVAGVTDLTRNRTTFMDNHLHEEKDSDTVIISQAALGRNFAAETQHFYSFSPVTRIKKYIRSPSTAKILIPPMMLLQGDKDALVSITDSKECFSLLKQYRNLHDQNPTDDVYLELPGAHHTFGYIKSPRARAMGVAMAAFMNKHFGNIEENEHAFEEYFSRTVSTNSVSKM